MSTISDEITCLHPFAETISFTEKIGCTHLAYYKAACNRDIYSHIKKHQGTMTDQLPYDNGVSSIIDRSKYFLQCEHINKTTNDGCLMFDSFQLDKSETPIMWKTSELVRSLDEVSYWISNDQKTVMSVLPYALTCFSLHFSSSKYELGQSSALDTLPGTDNYEKTMASAVNHFTKLRRHFWSVDGIIEDLDPLTSERFLENQKLEIHTQDQIELSDEKIDKVLSTVPPLFRDTLRKSMKSPPEVPYTAITLPIKKTRQSRIDIGDKETKAALASARNTFYTLETLRRFGCFVRACAEHPEVNILLSTMLLLDAMQSQSPIDGCNTSANSKRDAVPIKTQHLLDKSSAKTLKDELHYIDQAISSNPKTSELEHKLHKIFIANDINGLNLIDYLAVSAYWNFKDLYPQYENLGDYEP